ncbi:hypothetical protein ACRAWD_27965 [Caulobacter segnis]
MSTTGDGRQAADAGQPGLRGTPRSTSPEAIHAAAADAGVDRWRTSTGFILPRCTRPTSSILAGVALLAAASTRRR